MDGIRGCGHHQSLAWLALVGSRRRHVSISQQSAEVGRRSRRQRNGLGGAAGNEALATWSGEFNDPDRDGLHNYSGSNECNRVQISPESYIWIQLRWDDSWKGAATDLDFYITRQDNFKILGGSESRQSVSLTPYESVFFRGPAEDDPDFWRFPDFAMYCVVVKLISGDAPDWIQLHLLSPHILEHRTLYSNISSPMDSRNAGLLAVGATDWADNRVIWEDIAPEGPRLMEG